MKKLLILFLCSVCLISGACARHGNSLSSFISAWQPMLLGDGGAAKGVHVFPSGDIFAFTDTSNAYLYKPSATCAYGSSKALTPPCWQPLFTSSSVDASLLLPIFGNGNIGVVGLSQCQSNPNVLYAIYNSAVFVSLSKGATWTETNMTTDLPASNNTQGNDYYIACDPNNPDIAYTQTAHSGLFKTTNGTAGTGWAHVNAVTGSSDNSGGSIVFDPTSSVVGGVTQQFWVSSGGIGVYETTNGGGNLALTVSTSPTIVYAMEADKFGQLWTTSGFRRSGNDLLKRYSGVGGTWATMLTAASGDALQGILFDPNTGGAKGNNQLMVVTANGQITASFNNGTNWSAGGVANAYTSFTTASPAGQAAWLGTAWQGGSINTGGLGIDASGNLWSAGGISTWTTPYPISGCPASCTLAASIVWNANSVGIEQLVINQVLASFGNYPITTVWDRGVVTAPNADGLAPVQFPQITSGATIQFGAGVDYAPNATNVLIATIKDWPAVTQDGGNSWAAWTNYPTGQSGTGNVVALTDQKWCANPGNGGATAAESIYCTSNAAGSAWTQSTIPTTTITASFGATATGTGSGTNLTLSGVTGWVSNGDTVTGVGIPTGIIGSFGGGADFNGGTLYTTGTYTNVALTGGTGTGAKATVIVSGGSVTTVTLTDGGKNYLVGDVMSAASASIGGTGSGLSLKTASLTGCTIVSGGPGTNAVYVTNATTTSAGASLTISSNVAHATVKSAFISGLQFITGTGISQDIWFTQQLTGTVGDIGDYLANGSQLQLTSRSFVLHPVFSTPNVQNTGELRLAANKVSGSVNVCALDNGFNVLASSDSGATFAVTANTTNFDGIGNGAAKIQGVPGQSGNYFLTGGVSQSGHIWKSTDNCATWAKPNITGNILTRFSGFGFGAPKPGGSSYPAIYAHANIASNDATLGYYASFDGGAIWNHINAPSTQYNYAAGILDEPTSVTGDMNVYGRVYTGYGFSGSGTAYIDLADACPYVNFDPASIKPGDNAGKTGTITLTAVHSGLVPVTGVQFSVDGLNVGTLQTGQSTYSVSWASSAGAHTLKVQAAGNGCSIGGTGNSFSIPVTTH